VAADGSHGPRPFQQRRASTTFLRVPADEWVTVTRGFKTEFRATPSAVSKLWSVKVPTPVVAYRHRTSSDKYDSCLMVLTAKWLEPLGAISAESLCNEGFDTMAEFRRYWMQRTKRRFTPTRMVTVYRVRPWEQEDAEVFSRRILGLLYGEFMP